MTPAEAALAAAALGTSILSAVLGMVGGLILMGVFAAALPVPAAMVLHGATQFVANGFRAALLWRHVHVRGVLAYALGAAGSYALLREARFVPDPATVFLVLGAVPFAARLASRAVALDFSRPGAAVAAGLVVTSVQLVAGVGGPLLDVFFIDTGLGRRQVVATKAVTQATSHLLKLGYFAPLLAAGTVSPALISASILAALAGTLVGSRILERVSDGWFRTATRWLVLGVGVVFIARGLAALG